jgi:hypothetical protein
MTHDFSLEVHLLVGKLVPIVMITKLGGSRTNRHHTPNPQRVPHNQHKIRMLNVTGNPLEWLTYPLAPLMGSLRPDRTLQH